jgi:hypothetical protein
MFHSWYQEMFHSWYQEMFHSWYQEWSDSRRLSVPGVGSH